MSDMFSTISPPCSQTWRGGEVVEVCRRGRPVARIVPLPSVVPQSADWSRAGKNACWAAYPTPAGGEDRGASHRGRSRRPVSLYYDSGVLVKLYVREESSDAVARFLAERGEGGHREPPARARDKKCAAFETIS